MLTQSSKEALTATWGAKGRKTEPKRSGRDFSGLHQDAGVHVLLSHQPSDAVPPLRVSQVTLYKV